jgi:hypothetical protein
LLSPRAAHGVGFDESSAAIRGLNNYNQIFTNIFTLFPVVGRGIEFHPLSQQATEHSAQRSAVLILSRDWLMRLLHAPDADHGPQER